MLSLDLLRTTYRSGKFFCRFADTGKEENLLPAGSLLTLFREGKGRCRSELAMLAKPLISQSTDPKLAAGLEKLIHDTAVFDAPDPEKDYPAMRRELFAASGAAAPKNSGLFPWEQFPQSVKFDTTITAVSVPLSAS